VIYLPDNVLERMKQQIKKNRQKATDKEATDRATDKEQQIKDNR
jgi:hypothetical protein